MRWFSKQPKPSPTPAPPPEPVDEYAWLDPIFEEWFSELEELDNPDDPDDMDDQIQLLRTQWLADTIFDKKHQLRALPTETLISQAVHRGWCSSEFGDRWLELHDGPFSL